MLALRLYLFTAWTGLVVYTGVLISQHGALHAAERFIAPIVKGNWQGQFNIDFLVLLVLAALWTGWRNRWSVLGCLLALAALALGGLFLLPYLLVLLYREKGSLRRALLGKHRYDDTPAETGPTETL